MIRTFRLFYYILKNKSFPSDTNNLTRLVSWIVFYNGTVCINLTLGKRPKFILSFDLRRWGMASTVMTGKIYAPNQKGLMSNAKPSFDDNWHPAYSEGSSWDGKALNLRVYNTMK